MKKADCIRHMGTFSGRDEAIASLVQPGDAALVLRGVARLFVLRCPCRCGDDLIINLDHRTGPAWRFYIRKDDITLYPSYWRDTKCGSHFILWDNQILWCGSDDESHWWKPSTIEERVIEAMPFNFTNYEKLAESLDEIPWSVLQACRSLVRQQRAEIHPDRQKGEFRRSPKGQMSFCL